MRDHPTAPPPSDRPARAAPERSFGLHAGECPQVRAVNRLIVDWSRKRAPGNRSLAFPVSSTSDYTQTIDVPALARLRGRDRLAFEEYSFRGTPTMVRARVAANGTLGAPSEYET